MKTVTFFAMLLGMMMIGLASCGGGESAEGEGTDTTHTEGDGHAH